ncbi:hypothetical protein BJ508DRAFT_327181 [Ascobolus immersus RN42]|uniref:DUF7708 domain-containing protein n=1 Tax=Ascobolus immersus RN42 TaxID=1160509 RepID=A0A3N4I3G3_ASCIM|nr:hypothetical protein BJ508DRAFT_327181 [Ascobolus immersus RN42]
MSFAHPPPSYREAVRLDESKQIKEKARYIVDRYVADTKSSKLDGSIHPALDVSLISEKVPKIRLDAAPQDGEVDDFFRECIEEGKEVNLELHYKDVQAEQQLFLSAIEDFSRTTKGKYTAHIDTSAIHTIEQVWDIIDTAVEKYEKKAAEKGPWGRLRRAFRRLGKHSESATSWLGLIPNNSKYMSLVCGGFKLVIEAAAHLHNLREEVFEALADIPTILNSTHRLLAIYDGSKRLLDFSSELYVKTLSTLAHIIRYFQHKSSTKAIKALFQQSSFGMDLTEKLEEMRTASHNFNHEANLCGVELARKVHDLSQSTNAVVGATYRDVRHIGDMVETTRVESRVVGQEILEGQKGMNEAVVELKQLLLASSELLRVVAILEKRGRSRSPSPLNSRGALLEEKDNRKLLLSRLTYDKESAAEDISESLRLGARLSVTDQDRAVYIMKSPILDEWLSALHSTTLVINNNVPQSRAFSPARFVAAKLIDAFRHSEKAKARMLVVHHFCKGRRDDITVILNSLLAQLVRQCPKHVQTLDPLIKLGSFSGEDAKAVRRRLEKLIELLNPQLMVLCVIDNLSCLLDNERQVSLAANRMVKWLVSLTEKKWENGVVFKVLLTAGHRLHADAVKDGMLNSAGGGHLEVPRQIARGGGFKEMKWEMGAGRRI